MSENIKWTDENIYQLLKGFNVPVRMNDVKNPTPEFMITVIDNFMKDLSINPSVKAFFHLEHIVNPEISEDSVSLIQLIFVLNHLLGSSGRLNIVPSDIMSPKPKRTKKFLIILTMFWKYYFQKYERFQFVSDSLSYVREKAGELVKEINAMEEKHAMNLHYINAEESNELHERIKENAKKIKSFEEQRIVIDENYKDVKDKKAEAEKKIEDTKNEIIAMKQKIEELDECILHSPDKLEAKIQILKDESKAIDANIREEQQNLSDKQKKIDAFRLDQEEVAKDTAYLKDTVAELEQLRDLAKSYLSDKLKCEDEMKTMSQLQNEFQTKENLKSVFAERGARNKLLLKKQNKLLTENLQKLQLDVQDALACNSNLKSNNLKLDNEIQNIINDLDVLIEELEKAEDLTIKRKKEVYLQKEALQAKALSYFNGIKTALHLKFKIPK